jgi:AraC family transcriptional regulator of adaptative response/methylated-DNA-[protein]-cysteine methyltransferase
MDGTQAQTESYHFAIMRRALDAVDAAAAAGEPLSLDALADRIGLSAAHFQRYFSRWVGVSPKRYHQYLALGQAKEILRQRHTTLEAAEAAGLSGTGRLHDLFLRWEAMAPGDYARGGAGLTIRHGRVETPFGPALAMATERGLCGLAFTADCTDEAAFADLSGRWPAARYIADDAAVGPLTRAAFARQQTRLHLMGGPFQIKVWEALLRVPEGAATTYSDIAAAIGAPKAVRAVGTAVGRNPVSFLIPCHRALRKDGTLGGYHWGLATKRTMLAWESARADADAGPAPAR